MEMVNGTSFAMRSIHLKTSTESVSVVSGSAGNCYSEVTAHIATDVSNMSALTLVKREHSVVKLEKC